MKLATPRWRTPLILTGVLLLVALMAPAALGAAKFQLVIVNQPGDTEIDSLIRSSDLPDLNQVVPFVEVKLVDGSGNLVTNKVVTVGFKLDTGSGLAKGDLNVIPQQTVGGIATFGETSDGKPTLSIGTLNEPEFTHYSLIPVTTKGTLITGLASDTFNIWEDGDSCRGGGDDCTAVLRGDTSRGGMDTYTTPDPGSLGASELATATYYPGFPSTACPNQKVVFGASMFTNASQPNSPLTARGVFLRSHITRADFRAAGIDFGQAHVEWCIALKDPGPWASTGTTPTTWTDARGNVLYVASAPACPTPNEPWRFAPCITAQFSDGAGGNITEGWIPPGDPVRRT